jgi:hypothetical protein
MRPQRWVNRLRCRCVAGTGCYTSGRYTTYQLGQHLGIDLVGLHLRFRDRCGLQGIPYDELCDARLQNVDHRPGVRRRFQGGTVGLPQFLGREPLQLVPTAVDPTAAQDFPLRSMTHTHFDELLMNVQSHESNRGEASTARRSGKGSRQRVMGMRQLPLRARSSAGWIAGWTVKKPGSKPRPLAASPRVVRPAPSVRKQTRGQRRISAQHPGRSQQTPAIPAGQEHSA